MRKENKEMKEGEGEGEREREREREKKKREKKNLKRKSICQRARRVPHCEDFGLGLLHMGAL